MMKRRKRELKRDRPSKKALETMKMSATNTS